MHVGVSAEALFCNVPFKYVMTKVDLLQYYPCHVVDELSLSSWVCLVAWYSVEKQSKGRVEVEEVKNITFL
ncbi:hypothetical protein VNO80_09547 [Phaseolus coccineus]|uniref:Uncharacterized protein n=1 Tax=Phaseolus coccineus TaxID=3886 RepID=A0AAN9RDS9_PHACN